jgi:hypothetical protein
MRGKGRGGGTGRTEVISVGLQTLEEGDEEHGHAYRSRASGREHESVAVLLARHTYEGYGKRDEMVEERKVRRGSTRKGK